jgi:hypothetical protein
MQENQDMIQFNPTDEHRLWIAEHGDFNIDSLIEQIAPIIFVHAFNLEDRECVISASTSTKIQLALKLSAKDTLKTLMRLILATYSSSASHQ